MVFAGAKWLITAQFLTGYQLQTEYILTSTQVLY